MQTKADNLRQRLGSCVYFQVIFTYEILLLAVIYCAKQWPMQKDACGIRELEAMLYTATPVGSDISNPCFYLLSVCKYTQKHVDPDPEH